MKKMSKVLSVVFALALMLSLCSVGFVANADTAIPENGYAAVGFVDTAAGKAEVLLGTGEQGSVKYAGTAPTAGMVYQYSRDAENVYTFATPTVGYGSDPMAGGGFGMWAQTDNSNWWSWDANSVIYYYYDTTPIFIRQSATSWALTDRSIFPVYPNAISTANPVLYLFDLTANQGGGGNKDVGAAMIGNHDGASIVAPDLTGINGLPTTYKDLAALSTDLHTYSSGNGGNQGGNEGGNQGGNEGGNEGGNQGGNSPVTGDNGVSTVAIVIALSAVSMLAVLCVIERKKVLSK